MFSVNLARQLKKLPTPVLSLFKDGCEYKICCRYHKNTYTGNDDNENMTIEKSINTSQSSLFFSLFLAAMCIIIKQFQTTL